VPLCLTSWENQKKSDQKIVDLHKSGSSLGGILKCLKVPRSSVQTIVRKYKQKKVQLNHRTPAKDLVKMLEETGTKCTVKRVLYRHNLKGKEEGTPPKPPSKSQTTVCNCTWGRRSYFWEKCPLV
jgi:hypothetical protein